MQRLLILLMAAISGILMVAPSSSAQTNIILTTLAVFNGTNGARPMAGLIQGVDGNFYGTTSEGGQFGAFNMPSGGQYGDGIVFRMTPDGTLSTLVSFDQTNGLFPEAPLIQGSDGNLYGTTHAGGPASGTVFSITTNGTFNFSTALGITSDGMTGGYGPQGALVQSSDGNFYGMTEDGGYLKRGTVFQLTTDGTITFYSISPESGAPVVESYPYGGLLEGPDGYFYGISDDIGEGGDIFRMSTNGVFANVFNFKSAGDSDEFTPLAWGPDGDLYGISEYGGVYGAGAIFRVSRDGAFTNLVSFSVTNGSFTSGGNSTFTTGSGLLLASDGNFYGETDGGPNQVGTIFRMSASGDFVTLYVFTNETTNSVGPVGGLIQARDGNFYGMTGAAGAYGDGTIYRVNIPLQPSFKSIVPTNAVVALSWSAVAGRTYQLQSTADVSSANWNNLGGSITATNGIMSYADAAAPGIARFYRVQLVQ